MPNPPKPAHMRQHRIKTSTHAKLESREGFTRKPSLPKDREWHPMTEAAWKEIWSSPMVSEYIKADLHSFMIYIDLLERYWRNPSTTLATEIRLQRQGFGLDPLSRRRLQWEIKRIEKKRPERPQPKNTDDPRRIYEVAS